jgi:hypothetical protein
LASFGPLQERFGLFALEIVYALLLTLRRGGRFILTGRAAALARGICLSQKGRVLWFRYLSSYQLPYQYK